MLRKKLRKTMSIVWERFTMSSEIAYVNIDVEGIHTVFILILISIYVTNYIKILGLELQRPVESWCRHCFTDIILDKSGKY